MENKTVLITGASKGIGKDIARKFSDNGWNLLINYRSDIDEGKYIRDLDIDQSKIGFFKGDISKADQVEKMFTEAINKFKKIDVLVNNAGITLDSLAIRMTEENFKKVLDVNVNGVFYCMKEAAKHMMKNRSGSIVSISSIVGLHGNIGQINYAASKGAIISMNKTLALELAPRNIRCNCVAPGFIKTDMTEKIKDKYKEEIINKIPMKAFGNPEDVANLVYFLGSDESSYISGQVISVDGGMSI